MKEIVWDTIAELFEQALTLPAGECKPFLQEVCAGDPALYDELESLLAHYEHAGPFFESLGGLVPGPRVEDATSTRFDPYGLIGRRVDRYRVLDVLGAGGMGVVYKAEDTELQREVALKFLPPAMSFDARARGRFITEARAASGLDHPNICTVYEIGHTSEGQMFIAMAFYDGETLKQKIAAGPIPAEEAVDYALQIARGLGRAHQSGIVHRDIKPANVMVSRHGDVKILDFGLAKIAEQQLTQTGSTMGTVAYMSPEQARGEVVDARTDIWSLGVLLYEMITAGRPFKGAYPDAIIYSMLNEAPDFSEAAGVSMPDHVLEVIRHCLQKDPADRPPR